MKSLIETPSVRFFTSIGGMDSEVEKQALFSDGFSSLEIRLAKMLGNKDLIRSPSSINYRLTKKASFFLFENLLGLSVDLGLCSLCDPINFLIELRIVCVAANTNTDLMAYVLEEYV